MPTPDESDRLAATIRAWSERITYRVEIDGAEYYQVTAFYQGGQVTYRDHSFGGERAITAGMVASALWAMTAVVRRTRTPEGFCAFMSNKRKGGGVMSPDDLNAQAMFAEWNRVAHEAVALFGETFGHNKRGLLSEIELEGERK